MGKNLPKTAQLGNNTAMTGAQAAGSGICSLNHSTVHPMRYLTFHKSISASSPLVLNIRLGQAARADLLHFPSVEIQVQ